jgi:hypothetical protein
MRGDKMEFEITVAHLQLPYVKVKVNIEPNSSSRPFPEALNGGL